MTQDILANNPVQRRQNIILVMTPVRRTMVLLVLFFVFCMIAGARFSGMTQSVGQEIVGRGVWIDPTSKLIWTGMDNGKDVSWKRAIKYCRDLRLTGHSDWRLATLVELQGIYDKTANAPGLAGPHNRAFTWHVRGNLFLTGDQWSSSRRDDDRGRPSGYAWYFDFNEGRPGNQPIGFPYPFNFMRVLCVRGPGE